MSPRRDKSPSVHNDGTFKTSSQKDGTSVPISSQPSGSVEGEDSKSQHPDGGNKRIRKGRGFTDRYKFVRRYRTPSPEWKTQRSFYHGGRDVPRDRVR